MADTKTLAELQATHKLHTEYKLFWDFVLASYEGIRALLKGGHVLFKHERETIANFDRRKAAAYGFGYSQSIVDIFNFYLFKSPPKREMGTLAKDAQWELFTKDCDLYGADFEHWMLESQRYAGIMGHIGILVDKGSVTYTSKQQEIDQQVYPYVARYFPQSILDWKYAKDENNRPYLSMVKLLDEDGTYRIWTTKEWATYAPTKDQLKLGTAGISVKDTSGTTRGTGVDVEKTKIEPTDYGPNPFIGTDKQGEVPFIWLYNISSKVRNIGVSDIKDVAYIDGSIIRNLSEGEEVVDYGAFPMLRTPMKEKGLTPGDKSEEKEVGIQALMEFDPEHPESRPDWLDSAVAEPITAILAWIARKVEEIYRTSNAGGMAATEIQSAPKSGTALKSEFQLLNSKLVSKGANTEEAERSIVRYWTMWQNDIEALEKITVEYARTYDIENLAQDLENALTAKTIVMSDTFKAQVQKNVARQYLPNAEAKQMDKIDKEIDEAVEKATTPPGGNVPTGDSVPGNEGRTGPGTGQPPGPVLVPLPGGAIPPAEGTGGGDT